MNRMIAFLAGACILTLGVPVEAHRGVIGGMNREKTTLSRSSWRAEGRSLTGELVFLRHHMSHVAAGLPESAAVPDDLDDAALRDALASRIDVSDRKSVV